MAERIKVGDIVDVHFTTSTSLHHVEVVYTPCATGDSWTLKGEDGFLYNVCMFERMDQIQTAKIKEEDNLPF